MGHITPTVPGSLGVEESNYITLDMSGPPSGEESSGLYNP